MSRPANKQEAIELASHISFAARQARTAMRWTQEDAAEQIGITTEFYARVERGDALPSVLTLRNMANCLRVNVDVMLGRAQFVAPTVAEPGPGSGDLDDAKHRAQWRKVERRVRNASPQTLQLVTDILDHMGVERGSVPAGDVDLDDRKQMLAES